MAFNPRSRPPGRVKIVGTQDTAGGDDINITLKYPNATNSTFDKEFPLLDPHTRYPAEGGETFYYEGRPLVATPTGYRRPAIHNSTEYSGPGVFDLYEDRLVDVATNMPSSKLSSTSSSFTLVSKTDGSTASASYTFTNPEIYYAEGRGVIDTPEVSLLPMATDTGYYKTHDMLSLGLGETQSTTFSEAKTIYMFPYMFRSSQQITSFGVNVTTADGSSSGGRIGWYYTNADCSEFTLVHEEAIDATSTGVKLATFSPAEDITPGLYFLAIAWDTIPTGVTLAATRWGYNAPQLFGSHATTLEPYTPAWPQELKNSALPQRLYVPTTFVNQQAPVLLME